MGTLFVIATPIGNRQDLSPRACETLAACDLIAAEDTRRTGQLLASIGVKRRLISLNEHNVRARLPTLLEALASGDVGLVSDAGTPTISDPGFQLVDAAHLAGYPVRALPGPSSVIAALSLSGFEATPFYFVGYVPRSGGGISSFLAQWRALGVTVVCFESPNRIRKLLGQIDTEAPDAHIAVCRELTKVFEQVIRGSAAELLGLVESGGLPEKGEFVIVLAPSMDAGQLDVDELLGAQLRAGTGPSEAAKVVAKQTGAARSEIYRRALELRSGSD
jgi:16S rRNA (cytidine1402-2'-O)-methyltransferase